MPNLYENRTPHDDVLYRWKLLAIVMLLLVWSHFKTAMHYTLCTGDVTSPFDRA